MKLSVTVRQRFPDFELDVDFEAPPGVTALFGRSGSGKTSVVQAVAGLLRPEAGRVAVNGRTLFDTGVGLWLPPHRRRIGYVFQEGRLFPHLSVAGNLRYGRWFAKSAATKAGGEFDHVVELLGLGSLLGRRPAALSGGEKQRVAIGRALLSDPQLLLADEPLAALDEGRKAEILPYLERLRDETKIPILYVSHVVAEVARLATTVIVLDHGRVVRAGPAPEVLSDPEIVPMLGVREAGSILTGRVVAHHADGLTEIAVSAGTLFLPRIGAEPGSRLRIRIAAQDVILSRARPEGLSALNILPCEVTSLRSGHAGGVICRLRAGDESLLARITQRSATALGLEAGSACFAIAKTVSVAREDVGRDRDGRGDEAAGGSLQTDRARSRRVR